MEDLFGSCGLVATFIATLLEGEIFFITAIISSKLGAFSTKAALITGFFGSYLQGWFKYYVAKKHGRKLLHKRKKLETKINKYSSWFEKNPGLYIVSYKFLFGLTTVILVLSGLKNIGYIKFAIYSAISSLLWVSFFGFMAYHCANAVLTTFEAVGDYKVHIIGTLVSIGLIVFYVRHRRHLNDCIEVVKEDAIQKRNQKKTF